jgi:non-haem Fe2+, alpha-ketoglutarate-dependent halogenase
MQAVPGPGHYEAEQADQADGAARPRRKNRPPAINVREEEAIDVVLRAGEMSLHDIDIVHGSGPNKSMEKRIGFVVRFVTPQTRPLEGRPPAILVRGRDNEGNFHLVDPPDETAADQALSGMRQSAASHLKAMLHNLKSLRT